jgi:hypothetical protein
MDPKKKKTVIIIASIAVVAVVSGLIITYVIIPATTSSVKSPVDCVVSYTNWTSCSPSGVRSATGTITTPPSNGGAACPSSLNITEKCPVDCVVSDWNWGRCGYDGTRSGTRTVLKPAVNGGAECPPLTTTQACNAPVDCVVNWSDFSTCSPTGFQTSTGTITTPSANGGVACPTELVKSRQCGPKYIGCYTDQNGGNRVLSQFSDHKTVSQCNDIAKAAGSAYFGMQYWQTNYGDGKPGTMAQCWYQPGSTLTSATIQAAVSSSSSNYCKLGTGGLMLGDANSNAVYQTF